MPEENKDFIVKDKKDPASDQNDADGGKTSNRSGEKNSGSQTSGVQFPEINFATFIFSLNTSALVHMGMLEDPSTQSKSKNLPMAKQTIDVLCMMEEKTKGNLSPDEDSMLKNILYDLKIMYVKNTG